MPTFGISAYLKLISLNEKPRQANIRGRVAGGRGGYDFHRSMKRAAGRLLSNGASLEEVLESLQAIKQAPERSSSIQALKRLAEWRRENPGELLSFKPATYSHPSGLYNVTFTPDFGVRLGGTATAVHIWNTSQPAIGARAVYAALGLFPDAYEDGHVPEDFAVLCLRESRTYRLSAAGHYAGLSEDVADKVAEEFREAIRDLGGDDAPNQPNMPRL